MSRTCSSRGCHGAAPRRAQRVVVEESGRDEREVERDGLGDLETRALVVRAAATSRGRRRARRDVRDGARQDLPAGRVGLPRDDGDGHGGRRQPVQVVDGAVDRVDDPGQPRGPCRRAALLPQDRVVGPLGSEDLAQETLGGEVGSRDNVGRVELRPVDRHGLGALAPDLLGRGAGEPLGELPECPESSVVHVGVRHGHLPVRCRPKPCHGPGACQFILSDTRRIVRIANAIAAPTHGLKTSK